MFVLTCECEHKKILKSEKLDLKSNMNRIKLFDAFLLQRISARVNSVNLCRYASIKTDDLDKEFDFADAPVTQEKNPESAKEDEIEKSRNKSQLYSGHRNLLHGNVPYDKSYIWHHETVKYKRSLLGKYGIARSGVNPSLCFPTPKEIEEKAEYERVAFPLGIREIMDTNEKKKKEAIDKVKLREIEIEKKMSKLEQWTIDLESKVAKREAEAKEAKERKDRLVEEVRREFGFTVDTRDDRFKELLAQKEKEDKKKQKEAKRKVREAKMIEKLQQKSIEINQTS